MIELYEHELRIDEKALVHITDEEIQQLRDIAERVSQRSKTEGGEHHVH